MVKAVEKHERMCKLVSTGQQIKSFMWRRSTRVIVTTKRRHVSCDMRSLNWADDEKFNAHFHEDEYAPRTLTDYGAALKYHFAPGLFHRQNCPCDVSLCVTEQNCSFYQFPCHDPMSKILTNCTINGTNDDERLVHVDTYDFKPPVGPILLLN